MATTVVLGIDIGTSGIRGCLVELKRTDAGVTETILHQDHMSMPFPTKNPHLKSSQQSTTVWQQTCEQLFSQLSQHPNWPQIEHIVADATSSTVLLCTPQGQPLTEAYMYNDQQAVTQAQLIQNCVQSLPVEQQNTGATGASSTLSKVLHALSTQKQTQEKRVKICHQIDWFNFWLTGSLQATDENNALKLGFDSVQQAWPNWVETLLYKTASAVQTTVELPEVVAPGTVLSTISKQTAEHYGLSPSVNVYAGTTDSIAGFLASGANQQGDAVTSLGSTLAVKLISNKPVFNSQYGIYSHKLGNNWLVGGASNSGGAVLTHHYALADLIKLLNIMQEEKIYQIPLETKRTEFYPLIEPGERFPIANANKPVQLPYVNPQTGATPSLNTEESKHLLHAILTGLTNIEDMSFELLHELGASQLKRLYAVGGGTQNELWQSYRKQVIMPTLSQPDSHDAAFGVTRLLSRIQPVVEQTALRRML